ncbi:MAG TPA: hypothetical protein VM869_22755 [Enhygromyxa sp.]|nr:hypothetical protein [Enhygromyxa sp.]
MTLGLRSRDPLLALEFLSLTFACGSRPSAEQSATEESDTSSSTTSTHPHEDTDVDEWNPGGGFLDYGYYDVYPRCDPFAQDCPHGEKCVPVSNDEGHFDHAVCVLLTGDIPAGEPCTIADPSSGVDDCDATSMCWFVEDDAGVCVPLCSGAADHLMCPDGLSCFHTHHDDELFVCVPPCNPLMQDCPTGQACQWAQDIFGCSPTHDVPPPEPCAAIPFDCAAGSICLVAEVLDGCEGESCCTAYCDIEDPEACASFPGHACITFWDEDGPPTPELANIGVCITP